MSWLKKLFSASEPDYTEFDLYIDKVRNKTSIGFKYPRLIAECEKLAKDNKIDEVKLQVQKFATDCPTKKIQKLVLINSEAFNDPRSSITDFELYITQWICLERKEDLTDFIQQMLFGNYVEDYRHAHSGLSYYYFFIGMHGYKKDAILTELREKQDNLYYFHDDVFELMELLEKDPKAELQKEFWDGLMF